MSLTVISVFRLNAWRGYFEYTREQHTANVRKFYVKREKEKTTHDERFVTRKKDGETCFCCCKECMCVCCIRKKKRKKNCTLNCVCSPSNFRLCYCFFEQPEKQQMFMPSVSPLCCVPVIYMYIYRCSFYQLSKQSYLFWIFPSRSCSFVWLRIIVPFY